ncbi:hypothetical protein L218DRAFT_949628 [Marasmius fiardii PR-910]|nr:hypothetical protein L218DRAFT_949628 [Marasmius fiardii PR-910]
MAQYAPILDTGITLLNLFALTSTSAWCHSVLLPSLSVPLLLTRVTNGDRESSIFNECTNVDAFRKGEYDMFRVQLHRMTFLASEVAARTLPKDYVNRPMFLWKRLQDTVKYHHEVCVLMQNLENIYVADETCFVLNIKLSCI